MYKSFVALTLVTALLLSQCPDAFLAVTNDVVEHLDFGKPYYVNVNSTHSVTGVYNATRNVTGGEAVRVKVSPASSINQEFPVLIAIKEQHSILSFQVPISILNKYQFNNVSRILCPTQYNYLYPDISIDISTMSNATYDIILVADLVPILIGTGSTSSTLMLASPSEPSYLEYQMPPTARSVVVQATSDDDLCAVFSIQKEKCPVYDMVDNVELVGFHQTITRSGAITVQQGLFDGDRFFIVVVVKPNNMDCLGTERLSGSPNYNRTKSVQITIDTSVTLPQFVGATIGAFGFFLAFYIVALVLHIIYLRKSKLTVVVPVSDHESHADETTSVLPDTGARGTTYGSAEPSPSTSQGSTSNVKERPKSTASSSSSEISLDENSLDLLHDVLQDRDIVRSKTCLCVADLSKKPRKVLTKKYNLYIWNLISLAIFYVLPVIQLVITYQAVLDKTGNEDICYYNFRCAHKLSIFTAFNNVYSNIGYMMLGFLFIILVYRRDRIHQKKLHETDPNAEPCGIPQHFGVFYAMGIALVMEGVLSGCYHVCPSYYNFQFDTAFMYMIGWLCMIKIYQTRHPDVNAHAHTAYCVIAFVVFIGVIGVTQGNQIFWIIFLIFYIASIFFLSLHIYYVGRWRVAFASWRDAFLALRSRHMPCTRPMYMDRMVLLVLGNAVNWLFAGFGAVTMPKDFASYLLAIVLINLLMYFFFYVVMKLRCGEKLLMQPILYIIAGVLIWAVALYFFFIRLTSWQVSPAMSRVTNEDCLLLEFYDSHDIWHFLSSTSLFLGFMLLLTLEDDLVDVPRTRISVF